MEIKKTAEEIQKRYNWLIDAIDKEENQDEITQVKLWSQIDFIQWLQGRKVL